MFNKTQAIEDIRVFLPKTLWFIYHLITISVIMVFTSTAIYNGYMMVTATPEMIKQSELAGQYGNLHDLPGFIAFSVFASIGTLLLRFIVRFAKKRYFN